MAAVWILLTKTIFPATLIESSREHGVKVADVPFDISAEFLPNPDKPEPKGKPPNYVVNLTQILHLQEVGDEPDRTQCRQNFWCSGWKPPSITSPN